MTRFLRPGSPVTVALVGLIVVACVALAGGGPARAAGHNVGLPQKKPTKALVAQVQSIAKAQAGRDGFVPAIWIGVWDPKQGSYSYAYGAATPHRRASVNDVFRIGSITKTFTATVILQLVDQGRIGLSDTVARVDPDLARRFPAYAGITVRRLLSMHSGVADYLNGPRGLVRQITADPRRVWSADELIAGGIAGGVRRPGTPGYSTTNYIVLQEIAEHVTGTPLRTLIARRVTDPLGMSATRLPADTDNTISAPVTTGRLSAACAKELRADGGTGRPGEGVSDWSISSAQGGGAMQSNLAELGRWAAAGMGNVFLRSPTVIRRRQTVEIDPGLFYGLGLMKSGRFYGHEGEEFGWEALALHDAGTNRTIVVAVNTCGAAETVYSVASGIFTDAS